MIEDVNYVLNSLNHLLDRENGKAELEILRRGRVSINHTSVYGFEGPDLFTLTIALPPSKYASLLPDLEMYENNILNCLELLFRSEETQQFEKVRITPLNLIEISQSQISRIDRDQLLSDLKLQKAMLVSVSTGGPRIQSVNAEYKERRERLNVALGEIGLKDPVPFDDLWAWYGTYSSELESYASRRTYIARLIDPLIEAIERSPTQSDPPGVEIEPTGWERVDRTARHIRRLYSSAQNEEEFQQIGLLCRENLITLGETVYLQGRHGTDLPNEPSRTDSKARLDAYFAFELAGGSNEEMRRFAKAANVLANALTHNRTATRVQAGMCITATNAVVGIAHSLSHQV